LSHEHLTPDMTLL